MICFDFLSQSLLLFGIPFPVRRVNSTSALPRTKITYDSRHDESFNPYSKNTNTTFGVISVPPSSHLYMSDYQMKQMSHTRKLCLHNANVSRLLHQKEKADVWLLLAQLLENTTNLYSDGYDGWNSILEGALGCDMVEQILNYYENLGDVQMLATIVCVLSGGKHKHKNLNQIPMKSLLKDHVRKYDSYIYRYAAVLYRWGLIDIRSELIKHMTYSIPGAGGEHIIPLDEMQDQCSIVPNDGVAPGLSFATICPRCKKSSASESNLCSSCNDYAFRCSICTNSVRGLFTVCMTCSHGGHLKCIVSWFENHSQCPTGCGCKCTFNTFTPSDDLTSGRIDYLESTETSI